MSEPTDETVEETVAAPEQQAPRPTALTVKRYIDPEQLALDIRVNDKDLTNCMMQQPALMAYYGTQAANASFQVLKLRQLRDARASQVDKKIRDDAVRDNKKLTEALIEKEIDRHPKIIQVQSALNEAKHVESLALSAVESMRHRRDMLIQMGAQARAEMEGEIRIRSSEARALADRDLRSRALAAVGRSARQDADEDALPEAVG